VKEKTRRKIISYDIIRSLAFGIAISVFCSNALSADLKKPHIILFSIDTLRADHLGCYGYHRQTSPHIDKFARNSFLFVNTISQAPSTATSHMSIFTALTPPAHSVINIDKDGNYRPLNNSIVTLPAILKNNGYLTVGLHGGGQMDGVNGFDRGFDAYIPMFQVWEDPRGIYRSSLEGLSVVKKEITNWLRRSQKSNKPLFLFLHHYICHDPYVKGPGNFRNRYLSQPVPGLPTVPHDVNWDGDFMVSRKSFFEKVDGTNPEHREHLIALYDGGVCYSDHIFNEVINLFQESGYYDDSLIILTSDHGEEFYEHGENLHWRLFIETLHVPLIMKFPGKSAGGKKIPEPVRSMDIMPTILDYIKIPVPQAIQGTSFLPLMVGQGTYNPVMKSYAEKGDSIRIVKGEYIYSNQKSANHREWLFNQEQDPEERHNLTGKLPEILKQMREEAPRIIASDQAFRKKGAATDQPIRSVRPALREQLKALGYIN